MYVEYSFTICHDKACDHILFDLHILIISVLNQIIVFNYLLAAYNDDITDNIIK